MGQSTNQSTDHISSKARFRLQQIHVLLSKHKALSTKKLSQLVGASENTVRRDLTILEQQGTVRRFHGSASIVSGVQLDYSQRFSQQLPEKQQIAQQAAQLIPRQATVLVDAGSTCFELLQAIAERKDIAIITHSMAVLQLPQLLENLRVILLGGLFDSKTNCVYGPPTEQFLQGLHADMAFLGISAIDEQGNCYINNYNEIGIKQKMLQASSQKIGLADASKWGKKGLVPFANIAELDQVLR